MGQCRRSMPGLDLEAKDDFNFPVILSARRYEWYDVIIYGSRELGAFGGRIEDTYQDRVGNEC